MRMLCSPKGGREVGLPCKLLSSVMSAVSLSDKPLWGFDKESSHGSFPSDRQHEELKLWQQTNKQTKNNSGPRRWPQPWLFRTHKKAYPKELIIVAVEPEA